MNAPRAILGATYLGGKRCGFLVWAPHVERMEVVLLMSDVRRLVPLAQREGGYHGAVVEGVGPGTLYWYRLDGRKELADPASRFQPDGMQGASAVVDPEFPWTAAG